MLAADFIHPLIPALKISEPVGLALKKMEELELTSLPVVEGGVFLGFVEDEILLEQDHLDIQIAQVELECAGCWVYADQHLYDVLRVGSEHQAKWVAVMERDQQYHGVVPTQEVLTAYADNLSIHSQGSVLVISLQMKDFQLSEISRLIEAENTKILSCQLYTDPLDSQLVEVTLKLDKPDTRHVKATLLRFGYQVKDFAQEEVGQSSDEERIGNLLRFLDI
jgi:predicted transcriptional regulator